MTFIEYAIIVLRDEDRPLTYHEIWEKGYAKGYDKKLNSRGKTSHNTLSARLSIVTKDNEHPKIKKSHY